MTDLTRRQGSELVETIGASEEETAITAEVDR